MLKSVCVDGKRVKLSPKLPQSDLAWLVVRMGIGTADSEIETKILDRTSHWPKYLQKQAVTFSKYTLTKERDLVRRFQF